ncbi:MAG: NapC/NirT family cytochrome c [Anaerolineales bacterium]|nr:NapC/NirT family cytochrome c [Anaerolineales bacterium]
MKQIKEALRRFFFPPENAGTFWRVLPYAVLGLLTVAVFIGGSYGWEYTNSPEFCGTACHTMPPQYSAYLVSPHARVQCVECHIGREAFANQFTRKAGDIRHVVLNITNNYEYPIRATNMRPAPETCETCHFPEKFSDDSLQQMTLYSNNQENSAKNLYLIMKTGGGSAREGLGFGIHWHIENPIYFYAEDELSQQIPYIIVEDIEGSRTEYIDISADFDPSEIDPQDLQEMDCITCHNRITHRIPEPEVAVSNAVSQGLISADLPYVVRESINLLRDNYPDNAAALQAMNSLEDFYDQNYPEIYNAQKDEISQAITTLQEIYSLSVFPDQKIDWDSHPDNLGHKDDPGCFRCHDGKHFNQAGEAVRLECNICHSIPVISPANALTTDIEVTSGPEPPNHTLTTWIALHGQYKDNSCKACHTTPETVPDLYALTVKPPVDNSFCGNEACHSNVWTYAGFTDPALEPILTEQLEALIAQRAPQPAQLLEQEENMQDQSGLTYDGTIGAMLTSVCSVCHGTSGGLDVTSYAALVEGGDSGAGIVPGDPPGSIVFIRQSMQSPHYGQLDQDQLKLLEEWILTGAPKN